MKTSIYLLVILAITFSKAIRLACTAILNKSCSCQPFVLICTSGNILSSSKPGSSKIAFRCFANNLYENRNQA